jgi:hypothetical protein
MIKIEYKDGSPYLGLRNLAAAVAGVATENIKYVEAFISDETIEDENSIIEKVCSFKATS